MLVTKHPRQTVLALLTALYLNLSNNLSDAFTDHVTNSKASNEQFTLSVNLLV